MTGGLKAAMQRLTFGRFLVLLVVAAVAVNIATGDDAASERPDRGASKRTEDLIRQMYDRDLNRKRRRLGLGGRIGVTSLECAPGRRRAATIPCLAHVAATGEARRLTPTHVTVSVYFHHPHYFEYSIES